MRRAWRHVRNPQAPGNRLRIQSRDAAVSRFSHEQDAGSVRRPGRQGIDRRGRRQIPDRVARVREQRDEAVIPAVGHERERASVGRPGRGVTGAAHEKRLGGPGAVDRRDPDPAVAHERDASGFRSHRRFVAVADQLRRAAVHAHRPDLHSRLHRSARRIRCESAVRRPVGAVVSAAHVHNRPAVVAEREAGEFLAVVVRVRGDAPRRRNRAPPPYRCFERPAR